MNGAYFMHRICGSRSLGERDERTIAKHEVRAAVHQELSNSEHSCCYKGTKVKRGNQERDKRGPLIRKERERERQVSAPVQPE